MINFFWKFSFRGTQIFPHRLHTREFIFQNKNKGSSHSFSLILTLITFCSLEAEYSMPTLCQPQSSAHWHNRPLSLCYRQSANRYWNVKPSVKNQTVSDREFSSSLPQTVRTFWSSPLTGDVQRFTTFLVLSPWSPKFLPTLERWDITLARPDCWQLSPENAD